MFRLVNTMSALLEDSMLASYELLASKALLVTWPGLRMERTMSALLRDSMLSLYERLVSKKSNLI